ncbi:MAG: class I mannose-6-phosphate isomerase [Acidobacteriaceae bacterium]|nr:class I mannose-6-phosphate isomerase [Acidobacteriaceae bacterium]
MRNLPFQVTPDFRERVWGRRDLRPFFSQTFEKPIGEAWFDCGRPILVKLLFTSERLSVQVHPDDAYAQKHHGSLGKTEAWYVLDSQPPGEVAVGFKEPLTREKLKASALNGEIEHLLNWRKVKPRDLIFTPAGAVHAIGAGVTICEIQENSDITYRLYDYGRPRELHLERGVEVSHLGPPESDPKPLQLSDGREELVACEHFRIERLRASRAVTIPAGSPHYLILIGTMGEVWCIPADNEPLTVSGGEWLLTYTSETPAEVRLS